MSEHCASSVLGVSHLAAAQEVKFQRQELLQGSCRRAPGRSEESLEPAAVWSGDSACTNGTEGWVPGKVPGLPSSSHGHCQALLQQSACSWAKGLCAGGSSCRALLLVVPQEWCPPGCLLPWLQAMAQEGVLCCRRRRGVGSTARCTQARLARPPWSRRYGEQGPGGQRQGQGWEVPPELGARELMSSHSSTNVGDTGGELDPVARRRTSPELAQWGRLPPWWGRGLWACRG